VKLSTSPRSSLCCEWLEVLFTLFFINEHIICRRLDGNLHVAVLPCLRRSYAGVFSDRHIPFFIHRHRFRIYGHLRSFAAFRQIDLEACYRADIFMGLKLHRSRYAFLPSPLAADRYPCIAYPVEAADIGRSVQHEGYARPQAAMHDLRIPGITR